MLRTRTLISVLAATLLFVSGCVDRNSHKYPFYVIDNFTAPCKKAGESEAVCNCYAEKVQAKYTFGEFEELDKRMQKGERPPEFMKFVEQMTAECKTNVR